LYIPEAHPLAYSYNQKFVPLRTLQNHAIVSSGGSVQLHRSSGSDEEEEEEDTPLQLQKAHAARLAQGRARHRAAAQQMADLHRYR